MDKHEETNEPFYIRFKPSLMAKVEDYIEEANITKTAFFNEVLSDYFEGKVLTNDFIKLDKPFYFDFLELKEKGVVKASSEVPNHDLETTLVVYAVPNNFDKWNKEEGTYSSGSSSVHKGLYTFYIIIHNAEEYFKVAKIVEKNFLFTYDSSANTLEVSLIPEGNLFLYVPTGSDALDKLEEEKDKFYNTIVDSEGILNPSAFFKSFEVILPYKAVKEVLANINSGYFERVIEDFDKAELITSETEEGLVTEGYIISSNVMEGFYNLLIKPTIIDVEADKK